MQLRRMFLPVLVLVAGAVFGDLLTQAEEIAGPIGAPSGSQSAVASTPNWSTTEQLPVPLAAADEPCDPYEPNDNRFSDAWGPLQSGQAITAKLCQNDEDNYYFDVTRADPVHITLTLPASLQGHASLWLYSVQNLDNPLPACGWGPATESSYSCAIPRVGRYIARLYTDDVFDNVQTYTLRASFYDATPTPTRTPTFTKTPAATSTPTPTATPSPTVYYPPTPLPYHDNAMGVMPLLTRHQPASPLPVWDAGAGASQLAIQNVAEQLDNITTHYLGQGGYEELLHAAQGVYPYTTQTTHIGILPMTTGWVGAAALDGFYSSPPAAAARITWNSGLTGVPNLDTTGAAYSSPQSGTTLYFPYATVKPVRDASGRYGRFSTLTLMNTGPEVAAYMIELVGASDVLVADRLRVNESRSYNLADPDDLIGSELGGDWQGAIKVTCAGATQTLAGLFRCAAPTASIRTTSGWAGPSAPMA